MREMLAGLQKGTLKQTRPNNRLHRVREARSGGVNHDKLRGGFRAG